MRAQEQLPIYTFEGPQVEGRFKFKTCFFSLDIYLYSGYMRDLAPVRSGRSRSRNWFE